MRVLTDDRTLMSMTDSAKTYQENSDQPEDPG
jgi:hypothetical protein